MMGNDELKLCPFCGSEYYKPFLIGDLVHLPCDCLAVPFEDGGYDKERWNSRPLEDALRKQLEVTKNLATATMDFIAFIKEGNNEKAHVQMLVVETYLAEIKKVTNEQK